MKKYIVACLVVYTGLTGFVCAQDSNGLLFYPGRSKTNQLFGMSDIEWPRHHFTITLKNGNMVAVRVADKAALDRILNLDSILQAAWKDLAFLKDSLQNEMSGKRIDYITDQPGRSKIRFSESKQRGHTFVVDNNEPKLLKIEQDTLVIIEQQQVPSNNRPENSSFFLKRPYKIMLLINDINQLESLLDGTLNTAMKEVAKQWDELKEEWAAHGQKTTLSGNYNVANPALNKTLRAVHDNQKTYVEGYFHFGLQTISSKFVTNAGAGISIVRRGTRGLERKFQLFWEPYFLFDKQTDGKFRMRRNDFVTFQYQSVNTVRPTITSERSVTIEENLSLGYLVHRSGNFFRESTFKASVLAVSLKSLTLQPEFVFNGLFKNFQPGLKLSLRLD